MGFTVSEENNRKIRGKHRVSAAQARGQDSLFMADTQICFVTCLTHTDSQDHSKRNRNAPSSLLSFHLLQMSEGPKIQIEKKKKNASKGNNFRLRLEQITASPEVRLQGQPGLFKPSNLL